MTDGSSTGASTVRPPSTGTPMASPSSLRGRMRVDHRSDAGQTMIPFFFVAAVGFIAVALMLFQVGRATGSRANAQTAADAASLAAGEDVKAQIERMILLYGYVNWSAIQDTTPRAQADQYAERNGEEVISYQRDYQDIYVTTRELAPLGPDADRVDSGGSKAKAPAHARVEIDYTLSGVPGFNTGANGGSTGGGGPAGGGLPASRIAEIEDAAGVKVSADSALRTYGSNCHAGIDIAHLQPEVQEAIAKAEDLLDQPLRLNSAYRDVPCQVRASANAVNGYAAPPGRSLHNAGLAIDVANYAALASVASRAGLCQPFPGPDQDYVHFSAADGVECGGQSGPLGPGGAFGGNAASFALLDVHLAGLDGEKYVGEGDGQTPNR